jgi:UDP-N-acetylglucosamine acyltransferase
MIHSTAIIHPNARLADDVEVGAYSIIGIMQFNSLGEIPQDKKYAGEPTRLEIGDNNTIREFCTFNLGTIQDGGLTSIGDDNWIMAYVHIAHDCHVGNHTIMANGVTLAGHVRIDDWVIIGGLTGVHQFVRIGAHAMTGFQSRITQDVPPYFTVAGNPVEAHGINSEGLKRRGFDAAQIATIKAAYKTIYKSGLSFADAQSALQAQLGDHPELQLLVEFLASSQRGIVR